MMICGSDFDIKELHLVHWGTLEKPIFRVDEFYVTTYGCRSASARDHKGSTNDL